MPVLRTILILSCLAIFSTAALAQEHYTEGPVWAVTFVRTKQGHFDDYMKYLRAHYAVLNGEAKKQGLILDNKIFVKTPNSPNDWDVALATLFPSYAKALDFNQADDDKSKAIAAQHYKTSVQSEQQKMTAPRYEWRDILGTEYLREVTLKPMTGQ